MKQFDCKKLSRGKENCNNESAADSRLMAKNLQAVLANKLDEPIIHIH